MCARPCAGSQRPRLELHAWTGECFHQFCVLPGLEEWRCSAQPALQVFPAAHHQDETPSARVGSIVCVGMRGGGRGWISRCAVPDCLRTQLTSDDLSRLGRQTRPEPPAPHLCNAVISESSASHLELGTVLRTRCALAHLILGLP